LNEHYTMHGNLSALPRTPEALAQRLQSLRHDGERIAFVPTMGALHEGHLSLISIARQHAACVVVSIFVNPRQFGPNEDFGAYPRTEEADIAAARSAGADVVYLPAADVMYPAGYQTVVSVPQLAEPLDGRSRPGFFDGIATVVTKLFNQVRPDVAVFGEKDFQQLLVIRRLVRDLNLPIEVVGAPIVREADGLAMSSRNRYLAEDERAIAGRLNEIMRATIARIGDGEPLADALETARAAMDEAGLDPVDYLEVRHRETLALPDTPHLSPAELPDYRLFAAVMLGRTRLIDNMPLG
jgi:pantoate--beta-alanine ligase